MTVVNPAAAQMLGYKPEEILGKNMHELIHHSFADGTPYPKSESPIQASLENRTTIRVSNEVFWRKDGQRWRSVKFDQDRSLDEMIGQQLRLQLFGLKPIHRAFEQETSSGSENTCDCCPLVVTVPAAAADPIFLDDWDRVYDGPMLTVGKYCARASRTSARASMKFSKNCLMVWLLILIWSSSAVSSGSL